MSPASDKATGAAAAPLTLRGVRKSFGDVNVLRGLDLTLAPGEILALLGLSGSGKTTALRLVAGFEQPDVGTITVGDDDVTALPPAKRGFGMVFQHYALFPHMTVAENVAFGLRARKWPAARIAARVAEMLELVALPELGGRAVDAISGGQQQRVALARALAPSPRVLLLDEPLSNLDPALRTRTRRELRQAVKPLGITTLLVTHEQEEAFDVGDRVAVLHEGALHQVGTPHALYASPATPFVATFIGRAGRLPGRVSAPPSGASADDGWLFVRLADQDAAGSGPIWRAVRGGDRDRAPLAEGAPVDVVVRPEALCLVSTHARGAVTGAITAVRFTGPLTYITVRGTAWEVEVLADRALAATPSIGDTVGLLPRTADGRPDGRPAADLPAARAFSL
ncbi:MAG: ABC transporter ATP-binding protein [Acidobacteriota bacterium]